MFRGRTGESSVNDTTMHPVVGHEALGRVVMRLYEEGRLAACGPVDGDVRDALATLGSRTPTRRDAIEWSARLATRSAWETAGRDVITWFLRHDDRPGLLELFTSTFASWS